MLVDDPQAVGTDSKNKGITNLAQRLERIEPKIPQQRRIGIWVGFFKHIAASLVGSFCDFHHGPGNSAKAADRGVRFHRNWCTGEFKPLSHDRLGLRSELKLSTVRMRLREKAR